MGGTGRAAVHHQSPSGVLGLLLSRKSSRHFAAASLEVRCQTGRSSSTTMVSPPALSPPHLRLARCSAQTDCRGRIDPMCRLWGRGGRRYRAPQEPGCRKRVKINRPSLNCMVLWWLKSLCMFDFMIEYDIYCTLNLLCISCISCIRGHGL